MINPHAFDDSTRQIIGIAMKVHRTLGFGFLEQVYQNAMERELQIRQIDYRAQYPVKVEYKGESVGNYIPDLVINNIIVELKAQELVNLDQIQAQIINYLVATNIPVGLYINFGKPKLEFKRYLIPKNFNYKFPLKSVIYPL